MILLTKLGVNPDFVRIIVIMVGMMLAYQPIYAETCDPYDQLFALKIAQEQFLWYADVQVGGKYPNFKLKEYERNGVVLDTREGEAELLEKYACDFLSFSCYGSGFKCFGHRCGGR